AQELDGGSFAACGVASISVSQESFDCGQVGVNTVALIVTDVIGQTDTCFASVTVIDITAPVFVSCPTDIVIIPDSANCTAQANWEIPTAEDNCDVVVVSPYQSGDTFPVGITTVTYIATDPSENTTTCSFTVTVQPTELVAGITLSEGPCGYTLSCNSANDGEATVNVTGGCAPYSYLWSNSQTGQTVTGLSAGPISVTVTDANGSSVTVNSVVTAPEPLTVANLNPSVYQGGFNIACFGAANGTLGAVIAGGAECESYTYVWSGPNGFSSSQANINGLVAGTYNLTVTDANGCGVSQSVTLTQPAEVTLQQLQVTDATCKGLENGEAFVTVTGGTAPYSYFWPETNQNTQLATGLGAGDNIVIVTDANGCQYVDTATVGEPDQIIAFASGNATICPGSSTVISATATGGNGNYTFTWNQGLGTGASQTVGPTQTTVYTVQVMDDTGCEGLPASVTVTIAPSPVPSFTYTIDEPCTMPVTVQLTNTTVGATSFEWLIGGNTITDENPTVTLDQPGNYAVTLIATNGQGCSGSTTQQIVVNPLPNANFGLENAEGCYPLTVTFGNQSTNGFNYFWDFGNGNTSTSPNPVQTYLNPGSFSVSLVVTNQSGCSDTLTSSSAVNVFPPPVADFTVFPPMNPENGGLYEFQNNCILAETYNWNFGDGTETDQFSPSHDYTEYGGYYVTLTAVNAHGCADTAIHYISVELNVGLFVPNALVIGESGLGAVFQPVGRGIATIAARVFDKWGNLLWESSEVVNGTPAGNWDGMYRGQYVPQGSYVWNVEATFINGQDWQGAEGTDGIFRTTGTVTVIY
ncbi:MAG: HYR domain-containing protein, partial [Flavobacteriales bacterium]|nr:HYR domain-containing protein [Flavobacteriales bacterium]